MKYLFSFLMLLATSTFAFAGTNVANQKIFTSNVHYKKIDITIQVNGYTIHLVGNVIYNVNNTVSMNVTMTISGPGINVSLPLQYSGAINVNRGTNVYSYDAKEVNDEDKSTVDFILSHTYLPKDFDPSLVKVDDVIADHQ